MLGGLRFTGVMASETIIEILAEPDVTATRLPALQNIDMKHAESRAVVAEEKIGVTGFEPATSWSQTRRSTKLSYTPPTA
jgi:hypothetical protein